MVRASNLFAFVFCEWLLFARHTFLLLFSGVSFVGAFLVSLVCQFPSKWRCSSSLHETADFFFACLEYCLIGFLVPNGMGLHIESCHIHVGRMYFSEYLQQKGHKPHDALKFQKTFHTRLRFCFCSWHLPKSNRIHDYAKTLRKIFSTLLWKHPFFVPVRRIAVRAPVWNVYASWNPFVLASVALVLFNFNCSHAL